MSLTLNMVGGGGGGKLKDTDAVLIVTVPAGSTVTATKGGTTLTPTMWVKAADASLDCAIFSIPASQFDSATPWTITATMGTQSESGTVLITTNKEYEVTLSYYFSLFDRTQDSFDFISSGFEKNSYLSLTDYSGSYVRFTASGEYNPCGSWKTPLPNDVSQYSTLDICVYGSADSRNKVGVTNTIVTSYSADTWIAYHAIPANEGSVVQIPVTSSMAGKYFTVRLNGGKTFYIQYVRLV